MTSTAPAWYTSALAHPPVRDDVHGAEVVTACRAWGPVDAPMIVLVHGGAAHAAWWDHVAPALAAGHRVVAPDLAGHGDSGRLPAYTLAAWSRQVVEVVRARRSSAPALLVGHSMGGIIAMLAAHELGDEVAALLMVDAEVPLDREGFVRPEWTSSPAPRTYPDRATILSRFRTLPADEGHPPYVVPHVAEHSVLQTPDGWTWKFDPAFFGHDRLGMDDLRPLDVPVTIVRGETGLVEPSLADLTARALGHPHTPVTIPGSGHHVPLDQPVALVATIALAARAWCPSVPRPEFSPVVDEGAR
ncbi:alpha/beta fold hydrolase [Aeromicrobium sp. Leaf350]|uniref:alpha/beta fold hydrolase n=1 Tax=Aeromicrobium sp. Leaf350 TaxID=2876565 RepID=UPI001E30BE44|nr:alpha/beta hydrolase [Aeromicrobium sp. Leaf350]